MKTKTKGKRTVAKAATVSLRKHQKEMVQSYLQGMQDGWLIGYKELVFDNEPESEALIGVLARVTAVFGCGHCFANRLLIGIMDQVDDDKIEILKAMDKTLYHIGEVKTEYEQEFWTVTVATLNDIKSRVKADL